MFSKRICIKELNEVLIFLNLASLLEISGWPKPGNVHRTHNFRDTRFEHFLAGISSIQPSFNEFCSRIYNNYDPIENNLDSINIGDFYLSAAEKMMKYQEGGNVLLGHILILGPLSAAVCICLKKKDFTFNTFKSVLWELISFSNRPDI